MKLALSNRIISLGRVESVLDNARKEDLNPFDSVLAEAQTSARGQYRRAWASPKGGIFAALRLPNEEPFLGTEAASAIGALLMKALQEEGYPVLLKWPNDIILLVGRVPKKVCGILLEEREGILLAGIGINLAEAPQDSALREGTALRAGCLAEVREALHLPVLSAELLWRQLVKRICSFYMNSLDLRREWQNIAQRNLLWCGEQIMLEDGEQRICGVLQGIGSQGELVLNVRGTLCQFLSGSIRLCSA